MPRFLICTPRSHNDIVILIEYFVLKFLENSTGMGFISHQQATVYASEELD